MKDSPHAENILKRIKTESGIDVNGNALNALNPIEVTYASASALDTESSCIKETEGSKAGGTASLLVSAPFVPIQTNLQSPLGPSMFTPSEQQNLMLLQQNQNLTLTRIDSLESTVSNLLDLIPLSDGEDEEDNFADDNDHAEK